jgi:hypothetical protein
MSATTLTAEGSDACQLTSLPDSPGTMTGSENVGPSPLGPGMTAEYMGENTIFSPSGVAQRTAPPSVSLELFDEQAAVMAHRVMAATPRVMVRKVIVDRAVVALQFVSVPVGVTTKWKLESATFVW